MAFLSFHSEGVNLDSAARVFHILAPQKDMAFLSLRSVFLTQPNKLSSILHPSTVELIHMRFCSVFHRGSPGLF